MVMLAQHITPHGAADAIVAHALLAEVLVLAGDAPRWLYYFNGFSVFWYLHLDCLDGKQARRTKSSSPLGQLFDHGEWSAHNCVCTAVILEAISSTASHRCYQSL